MVTVTERCFTLFKHLYVFVYIYLDREVHQLEIHKASKNQYLHSCCFYAKLMMLARFGSDAVLDFSSFSPMFMFQAYHSNSPVTS